MIISITTYHEQISKLTQSVYYYKQQIATLIQQLKESTTMLK